MADGFLKRLLTRKNIILGGQLAGLALAFSSKKVRGSAANAARSVGSALSGAEDTVTKTADTVAEAVKPPRRAPAARKAPAKRAKDAVASAAKSATAPKRGGRKPATATSSTSSAPKRGRKTTAAAPVAAAVEAVVEATTAPKRAGRKPAATSAAAKATPKRRATGAKSTTSKPGPKRTRTPKG